MSIKFKGNTDIEVAAQEMYNALERLTILKKYKEDFGKTRIYEVYKPLAWSTAEKAMEMYQTATTTREYATSGDTSVL